MTDVPLLTKLTADIARAMVASNRIEVRDVPRMIADVHNTLQSLGKPPEGSAEPEPAQGAVTVRKSLSALPEKLISMIDGRPYSSLKRHLTKNGFTPDSYREHFGLKADYPMVAPAYSEKRRTISIALGLGRKPAPPPPPPAPKKREKKVKDSVVAAEPEIVPAPEPEAAPVAEKPKRQRKLKPAFAAEPQPEPVAEEEPVIEDRVVLPDPDAEFFPDD